MTTQDDYAALLVKISGMEAELASSKREAERLKALLPAEPTPVKWAWQYGPREGSQLSIQGKPRYLRYWWSGSRLIQHSVPFSGTTTVSAKFFGGDPATFTASKGVQIYLPEGNDATLDSPVPDEPHTAQPGFHWELAAKDGEKLPTLMGGEQLKYGEGSRWCVVTGYSGAVCGPSLFSADPSFGKPKAAYRLAVDAMPVSPPSGNQLSVQWAQINNNSVIKGLIDVGAMGVFEDAQILDSSGELVATASVIGGLQASRTASFLKIDTTRWANGTYVWTVVVYDAKVGQHKTEARTGPLTVVIAN